MKDLLEELNGLCNIREDEMEMDRTFSETQQLEKPQTTATGEKQTVCTPTVKVIIISWKGERWKLVTSVSKRKALAPPKGLRVQTSFNTLKGEEEINVPTSTGSVLPNPKLHNSPWKKL